MMCLRCQHENAPSQKFCGECGARLAAICSSCAAPNPPAQKFCGECGAPLTHGISGATPRSPEAYTPRHLAEKILISRSALEGERKQVTVLFADLKGSMELLADRDPEEARKILDPVLELMMEAVHRYEGTVNQVMGDGIMALFGAPIAHEDHAVRACYAALRMQEAVKRYAGETRRVSGIPLAIRVGLNSGEVVVRSIAGDLHMDYTAVGQTTHLAARMEQAALPGSTLLTLDTLRLAEGFVEVRPLGPMTVKGLAQPVEAYELAGGGVARTRFQAAAARGLTRFVGREAEVDQLRHALERAAAGNGQLVTIVGEAGVGKSRLVYEFTHSHRVQSWAVLESGSVSYGKATAYLPVIDLLKSYCNIQGRDDPREIRDKVIGRLLGLDRSLEPLLPPLLALLDVSVEDAAWQALDPPERRQRTLDSVKRLLIRESQVQPLLLVIEDLHWIDGETQALLDSLVESLGSLRMLVLVDYRPEYEHRWGRKTYYTQLRLESLPPQSTADLLRALLGNDPGLEPLTRMLHRRGNPFFLEETVRALVETKALTGERGAYRLVRPVESLQIPATVQAILAARIDRLPMEEKQLLQTASVVGKDVPVAILSAVAELPEPTLRSTLGHLHEAEFLYETSLFPDLEYTFKHALTHEVAYGSLLQERRRTLRRWPGARTSAVARTRFIDDAVEAALSSGIEQVVLLGAGFDARAYRIASMTGVIVFEVDHPSTSAKKRTAVESVLGSVPGHVRFVPVDFNSASWQSNMTSAGYDPHRRTLFIWEGVTNYLTEDAVDATLRWCAGAAAGSRMVFTYVHRQVLDAPHAFEGTERLFATLGAAGERWTFGLDPPRLSSFLAQRGLILDEDVGASDYRARYFGSAAARMRGYEFYRIAIARVREASADDEAAQQPVQRAALRASAEPCVRLRDDGAQGNR